MISEREEGRIPPPRAHSAAPRGAREKACRPVRPEPVPACDAGSSGGPPDDAEILDCRNAADPRPQLRMFRVAAILWRSTCRQYSNPDVGIVVESAAAAAKPDQCGKPPRGYRMQGAPARGRAEWAAVRWRHWGRAVSVALRPGPAKRRWSPSRLVRARVAPSERTHCSGAGGVSGWRTRPAVPDEASRRWPSRLHMYGPTLWQWR
jgi:hypothetical protein